MSSVTNDGQVVDASAYSFTSGDGKTVTADALFYLNQVVARPSPKNKDEIQKIMVVSAIPFERLGFESKELNDLLEKINQEKAFVTVDLDQNGKIKTVYMDKSRRAELRENKIPLTFQDKNGKNVKLSTPWNTVESTQKISFNIKKQTVFEEDNLFYLNDVDTSQNAVISAICYDRFKKEELPDFIHKKNKENRSVIILFDKNKISKVFIDEFWKKYLEKNNITITYQGKNGNHLEKGDSYKVIAIEERTISPRVQRIIGPVKNATFKDIANFFVWAKECSKIPDSLPPFSQKIQGYGNPKKRATEQDCANFLMWVQEENRFISMPDSEKPFVETMALSILILAENQERVQQHEEKIRPVDSSNENSKLIPKRNRDSDVQTLGCENCVIS